MYSGKRKSVIAGDLNLDIMSNKFKDKSQKQDQKDPSRRNSDKKGSQQMTKSDLEEVKYHQIRIN